MTENEEMVEMMLEMTYELIDESLRDIARDFEKDFNLKLEDKLTGGKRFRPSLTIIVNQALGGDMGEVIPYAVIVELIHEFSLIHDDVMDHDTIRRDGDALWVMATVGKAIMTGDAGFGKVVKMASELGPDVAKVSGATIYALAKGVVSEFTTFIPRNKEDMEKHIVEIMNLKTASLFSLATELGSISAGADGDVEGLMIQYGKNLGLAYQLADDLVDLKKSLADGGVGDIKDHRITYPLYAYTLINDNLSNLINQFGLRQISWEDIRPILLEHPEALDISVNKITEYTMTAKGIAKSLPVDNEYKDVLIALPEYMVLKMLGELSDDEND